MTDPAIHTTLRVLSVQSDILGHRTYCESMRRCFAGFEDVDLAACWYHEGRTFLDRVLYKLAHRRLPLLTDNRDYQRARAEWSVGRMGTRLARKKLAAGQYDLLHFHTQVQAFGAARLMRSIPAVIGCDMTAYQIARESTVRFPETHKPSIAMERAVFAAAAHIVTWSEWARRSVIEEHGIGEDKVTAILPGARLETFAEPCFDSHEKPRILFVGGDFARKGGQDLLDVFTHHLAGRAELHLVTGHPVACSAPDVFVHRGIVAYRPEWHRLFRMADIFAMPSHAEAFGLVFQEAAGYGLAMVGTKINAIPEMVIEGENGFLVEPGGHAALQDKLLLLVENRDLLERMRRRSREIALERFDAAKNFRALADLFRKVVERRRQG
jgi:glycosyltransferase involved in cell wall biosynthesis